MHSHKDIWEGGGGAAVACRRCCKADTGPNGRGTLIGRLAASQSAKRGTSILWAEFRDVVEGRQDGASGSDVLEGGGQGGGLSGWGWGGVWLGPPPPPLRVPLWSPPKAGPKSLKRKSS